MCFSLLLPLQLFLVQEKQRALTRPSQNTFFVSSYPFFSSSVCPTTSSLAPQRFGYRSLVAYPRRLSTVTCWPKTNHRSATSTSRGRTAQPESQMTCSTMESTAPATMSHGNHAPGTTHRRSAAAARRKQRADTIARMGVSVFSTSPRGRSVNVSTAKGQSNLPPTHQGGGVPPAWRGTIAVTLSCAARSKRMSMKIHITYLLLLSAVLLFQKSQKPLRDPNAAPCSVPIKL